MVRSRITQAPACEVIKLTADELKFYHGCGWHLAHFRNGQLVDLKALADILSETPEPFTSEKANANAVAYVEAGNADGEVWLVMCSGTELCEPRHVWLGDALSYARMIRLMHEEWRDF